MTNLTWARNGEWGVEGVDLAALPPKIYGALYRLHQLEHYREDLLEQLAWMMGVGQWELQDKLDRSPGPWHPVEELPPLFLVMGQDSVSSRRLLLHSVEGDVWPGFYMEEKGQKGWHFLGSAGYTGTIDQWMEMPRPEVSNLDTREESDEDHA